MGAIPSRLRISHPSANLIKHDSSHRAGRRPEAHWVTATRAATEVLSAVAWAAETVVAARSGVGV